MDDTTNSYTQLQYALRQARKAKTVATGHLDAVDSALTIAAREHEYAKMAATVMSLEGPRARVTEPPVYGPDSPHSWFADVARSERGQGDREAAERLRRHQADTEREQARRAEAQARAAELAWQEQFYSTPAERRAVDSYLAAGGQLFETRGASRTDGQGGYLVPPGWLVDQWVPPARTGTELASLFTQLPLPKGVDTINVPIAKTGTRTGPGTDLAAAPGVDLADTFCSGRVVTVTGIQDAAQQWIEQGTAAVSGGLDKLIFGDLMADAGLQLDGQLWVGANQGQQVLGLLPPQTAIGTSLAVYAPNGNTNAAQQYSYNGGSGTALATTVGQCISGVARARGLYPTHLISHGWVYAMLTTQVDQQSRLLIEPHGPHPMPTADPGENGVLGFVNGLRFVGAMNCPTSFGNTGAPAAPFMGYTTGAQFAPTAGTGSYTPIVAVHAPSLYLWTGEPQLRCLSEVLGGTLQVRFQLIMYAAALVQRYQAIVAGTMANSGGWAVGANSAYGVVMQAGSNSLLSLANFGG